MTYLRYLYRKKNNHFQGEMQYVFCSEDGGNKQSAPLLVVFFESFLVFFYLVFF